MLALWGKHRGESVVGEASWGKRRGGTRGYSGRNLSVEPLVFQFTSLPLTSFKIIKPDFWGQKNTTILYLLSLILLS